MIKLLPHNAISIAQVASMILVMMFMMPLDAQAKSLKVCSVEIPGGLMTTGNDGTIDKNQPYVTLFNEITTKVSAKTGYEFSLIIRPAARCAHMFAKREVDIVWPFIISEDPVRVKEWGYPELPVYSMPIIMGGYYIFTRKDEPVINDIVSLEGKTVVHALGYGIPVSYEKNDRISKQAVANNEQIPKMLTAGRIDAGILQTGWVPGLKREGLLDDLHHGTVIDFWGGGFCFHPDEEGISLANTFTNVILKMIVSGRYKEIMTDAPYFIPEY
ncbi:substrate-binding periplasmic protein [Sneathiella limimaris]|uniref:substrate-binding periplasmic protein n=1 Tax=Sneathiella limimaris TaxID=1964213 RepID=UPI00146A05B1|nr:transporter substrate-binding domain-containing protein [Sneathiella limimaris]